MSALHSSPSHPRGLRPAVFLWQLALYAAVGLTDAAAQVTLGPTAVVPDAPVVEEGSPAPTSFLGDFGTLLPLFRLGPVRVHPHPLYRFMYSDGLQTRPGHPQSSYITRAAAGVGFVSGQWTVDYTPVWVHYTNQDFRSTWDHFVSAKAAVTRADWSATFSEIFSSTKDPLVETARQTGIRVSTTTIGATLELGNRLSFESTVSQNLNFIQGLPDWYQWDVMEAVHYRVLASLDTSVGVTTGYLAMYKSADTAFVRPHLQLSWNPSQKLSVMLRGGVEERKYLGGRETWAETPILSAAVRFQPIQATAITLDAGREVSPSYSSQGLLMDSTDWSARITQRLLKHFQLQVGMLGREVTYSGANRLGVPERRDRQRSYDARLSTTLLRRGTVAAFFRYNRNDSSASGFGFVSHQIGAEIGFRF